MPHVWQRSRNVGWYSWSSGTGIPHPSVSFQSDGPALVAHARLACLLALQMPLKMVGAPVLYEHAPGAAEDKRDVELGAFVAQGLHPLKMARARPAVVLPVA